MKRCKLQFFFVSERDGGLLFTLVRLISIMHSVLSQPLTLYHSFPWFELSQHSLSVFM